MQPGSSYHLIEAVGSCQVGSVWSAVDAQGRSLMVALLDATVATDQRWREAFAAAANALVQAGEPGYLYADFAASAPWAAYAAENGSGAERVFLALGMDFQAMPPDQLSPVDHAPAVQPLPPDVIDSTTPHIEPTPPVEAPEATTAAQATPVEDAEATQRTQRMEPTPPPAPAPEPAPAPGAAPVNPWAAGPPQPVSPPPQPVSPSPVSPPPGPVSVPPRPISGPPQPISGSPHSISGPPQPISGMPQSPAFAPYSPAFGGPVTSGPPTHDAAAPQYGPRPPQGPSSYDPYPPVGRRRTGLWVVIGALVLLLIAGGGGAIAWSAMGGEEDPAPQQSTPSAPGAFPTGPPASPGVEPPKSGKWPANWPKYTERDNVRTLADLEGLGFPVKVPLEWQCTLGGRAEGYVKYDCGAHQGAPSAIGGELIVRNCPQPCDEARQTTMRQAEEAWGVPWIRTGQFSTLGETILEVDGQERHALVVIAYWRSGSDGAVDRQLVLRLTAPQPEAQTLRRLATYLRDTLVF